MPRSPLLPLIFSALLLAPALRAATVLTLEGDVQAKQGKAFKPVALGQRFKAGTLFKCPADASLHLALSDGSTLALAGGSELELKAEGPGKTVLVMKQGLAFLQGATLEVQTANAVIQAQASDLEVAASPDDSTVSVASGSALLGDAARRRFEPIPANKRRRFTHNRLLAAETLSRRDASALGERWQRSRLFHQQREILLKNLKK